MNWFGTVRGRVGFLAAPGVLLYGTGGFAYGEVERRADLDGFTNAGGFGPFSGNFDNKSTKTGWTVGGGVEWKLPGAWSAVSVRAEYLYMELGDVSDTLRLDHWLTGAPGATRTVDSGPLRENLVRVGLNYQF